MNLFSLLKGSPLQTEPVWRNLPTCHPTKDLYYPEHFGARETAILQAFANLDSGIDHDAAPKDRWFEYGKPEDLARLFDRSVFHESRFSDGTFPVWYGSDSQECSRAETIFHVLRQVSKDRPPNSTKPIRCERVMYRATISCQNAVDLVPHVDRFPALLEDGPPYSYCPKVGAWARNQKVDGIKTLSKRHDKGACYAVIEREAIVESRPSSYFSVIVEGNGEWSVETVSVLNESSR